jgi:hypothetical protein
MPRKKKEIAIADDLVDGIQRREVLRLYLSATPFEEIVEKTQLAPKTIKAVLKEVESNLNYDMASLAERITLLNLARTQELVSVVMPLALEVDLKAMRILLDIIKLQQNIAEGVKPKEELNSKVNIHIEKFEQTLTSTNPLYAIAQENMEHEWLGQAERSIDEIYNTPVLEAPAQLDDEILDFATKIEQEYGDELEAIPADDD